jgi:LysR family nod box-dependent transcriptional activator
MRLRDFDINLLVTMEAIWAGRSVSMAAKKLNLAQSTISAALNRLRQTLGDDLFTWSGSEMIPTALAEQLMPEVHRILQTTRLILEEARGDKGLVERRLTIATSDYVVAMLGAPLIRRASTEMPHLSFDFVLPPPTSVKYVSKTNRLDIDLFVLPANALRISGMNRSLLYEDRYVCAGRRDHPRLRDDMSCEDFLALTHIGYSALPKANYNHETMLWDELSIDISYQLTMSSYLIFPRILTGSDAVAILPKRLVMMLSKEWKLRWIVPPLPTPPLEINALWSADQDDDRALVWLRRTIAEIAAAVDGKA